MPALQMSWQGNPPSSISGFRRLIKFSVTFLMSGQMLAVSSLAHISTCSYPVARLPTDLPTYLPTYLPACLLACLPALLRAHLLPYLTGDPRGHQTH
jgi:hypothetical protein